MLACAAIEWIFKKTRIKAMVQSALWHTPVNASSTAAAGSGFAPMTRLKTAARTQ